MRETRNTTPAPARPPQSAAAGGAVKPTPARLVGGDPRAAPPAPVSASAPARAASGGDPEVREVALEAGGACWKVRVLGRSGSSETRSPPLLLLGFWAQGSDEGEPAREATVVARDLAELSIDRLEEAFVTSSPPRPVTARKPFFEGAAPGRRGGS